MATLSLSSSVAVPPAAPPRRVEALEGVRALAALWVVCSHLWISQFGLAAQSGVLGTIFNWLLYSHLAVDVFIVLSGFCLFLPVVRDGDLRGGPMAFWVRRARRILPPLYLSLALSVGVTFLLQRMDGVPVRFDLAAVGVNLFLLQDVVLRDNVFNGPLWSVAVEWRLSLLFPALAWLLRRGGAGLLLIVSALAGYALTVVVFGFAPDLLMSCPWYLLLFAMGMCAASCPAACLGRYGGWGLGAGAFLLLVWVLRAYPVAGTGVAFGLHMPLTDPAVGVLTALLLLFLKREAFAPRFVRLPLLTSPVFVGIGQFSYSLYLTHAPLLRLMVRLLHYVPFWGPLPALEKFALLVGGELPLLIGSAYLFFLTCERPFLKSGSPFLNKRWQYTPT